MSHCGSMKNKDQLEKQLLAYFKEQNREDLPQTKEDSDALFSDEDHRTIIMQEIREFSMANNSPSGSENRR